MIDQTGINSHDQLNDSNNEQDNYPQVYSSSTGQVNIIDQGNKKEQEGNINNNQNHHSPQTNNQIDSITSFQNIKKFQNSSSSSSLSYNKFGTDKKKIDSSNNFQGLNKKNKQEFQNQEAQSHDYNLQFSIEQGDIKLNQADSLALSDNHGLIQTTNNHLYQQNTSQDFENSHGHISELGDLERSHTDIYQDQSNKSKKKQSQNINNHRDGNSSQRNNSGSNQISSSIINVNKKPCNRESSDENSNLQVNHNHPKRDPDFGGGSEPFPQRNSRQLHQQRQIASSHQAGNLQNRNSRNPVGLDEASSIKSQKIESDLDSNCPSHLSCESSSVQSPFRFLNQGQFRELNSLCRALDLKYTEIVNEQGNNMITKAVQNKDLEGIQQLLIDARQQLKEQGLTKAEIDQQISEWINKESRSGYTAAHFSCYVGDPQILLLLKSEGADFMKLNNEGSSGLHVAAQNDSIASIVFLLLLGINVNIFDLKDATPLHWASFQCLDQSVLFLIAFGADPNKKDSEGMTPLILSSISGSLKIVRILLLSGAERNLKDKKDRSALYMVTEDPENKNEDIAEMLKRTNGFQEYWNIRPVFKPSKQSPQQVIYYLIMYFIFLFDLIYFNYTLWDKDVKVIIISILIISAIITKFFFLNSWLRNPGYVSSYKQQKDLSQNKQFQILEKMSIESYENHFHLNQEQKKFFSKDPLDQKTRRKLIELFILLQKEQDPSQLCAHCCILKPKRSRHCDICKKCVSVYDHHCPWINNCVGTKNHAYFLGYVLSIWISILIFSGINIAYIWKNDYPTQTSSISSPVYIDPFNLFTDNQSTLFFVIKIVTGAISLFFCILFGFPLTLLLLVQIVNFSKNKTTYERFSQQNRNLNQSSGLQNENRFSALNPDESQISRSLIDSQPVKNSYSSNCLQMCFKNKMNSEFLFREIDQDISQA